MKKKSLKISKKAFFSIFESTGEDPTREGLIKTPQRVAKLYKEQAEGYHLDQNDLVNRALLEVEHHLLPFFGKIHLCYIPKKNMLGLSKFPRIVEMFSKRLQMQERLTAQIAKCIEEVLDLIGFPIYI